VYSLSGLVLSTLSVDAGWRVSLSGEARQPLHGWDGRYSQRRIKYDEQLRPQAVFEHTHDGEPLCTERYGYGGSDPTFATRNQCGQLIRHDDPAGTQLFEQFGLTVGLMQQTRHFLRSLDSPDWPEPLPDRDLLLEAGTGATSRSVFNALGETIEQTDAKGHRQHFAQNLAGQLHEVRLQLDKQPQPKTLVSAIQYNAQGQTEREIAGNGVITALHYAPEDGRLTRLQAQRGNDTLQDLRYAYDPVGNVLNIEDAALPIRYFANQRVEPINRYGYDSLYQLVKATGWEAGGTHKGPQFSAFDDPQACANFTQTYRYDRGGNLLELTHEGPQNHGHRLLAAAQSNRCLPVLNGVEPDEEDFRNGFDANGNLLALQPGQSLHWDLRNQLREVRPVARDGAADDNEHYVYGADGMRLRKVRQTQTNARTLIAETRYLPNLQIRTHSGTGETLQVISVQAGRSSVQVLHWKSEPPQGIANDQLRYSLNDHLGSCTLELDSMGQVISHERYHPFGTTAWFAGRGEIEASYKTLRYSGKERDATGLYYYGFRYYAAWLQRWLNPDPAGVIDGLNVYIMVKNNPVTYFDRLGLLTFAELFSTTKDELPVASAMANELDNFLVRAEGIDYSESYIQRDGKHIISLKWTQLSDHYFPNPQAGENATDISKFEPAMTGSYAKGFVTDLHRSDYSISMGMSPGQANGFEIQMGATYSAAEKMEIFTDKIPDANNRARISEVVSQVSLAETFLVAHEHVVQGQTSTSGSRANYAININEDESTTIVSSTAYDFKNIKAEEKVAGLRLTASVEIKIGAVNGQLAHDVLAQEPIRSHYEITFERTASATPPVRKGGFFNKIMALAGHPVSREQTSRQLGS
jgi:insecticidal toxin complex protein TccC